MKPALITAAVLAGAVVTLAVLVTAPLVVAIEGSRNDSH
jgi:hypothetical protein